MEDFALPSWREREKSWKNFWKSVLNESNTEFKKTWFTIFDWSKNSFDQSKQTKTHWNFYAQFRLIEKQTRAIEIVKKMDFWKSAEFDATSPQSIEELKKKNAWVWDEMIFTNPKFKTQFFQKFRFQTISPFFLSNKTVLHKTQSIFQTWLVKPKTHTLTCTMFSKE